MVEEVFSVADELAFGVEVEAVTEGVGGAVVQRADVESWVGGAAADLVRGELVAPAGGIPDAGVIGTERDGPIDQRKSVGVVAAARDEMRREMLERLDVVGVEFERAPHEINAGRGVVCGLQALRLGEQCARRVVLGGQCSPSTSASASCSVNTRKLFVRTLPWLLTASATRVIVSSSGASAVIT